jgi:hypothetical protein
MINKDEAIQIALDKYNAHIYIVRNALTEITDRYIVYS